LSSSQKNFECVRRRSALKSAFLVSLLFFIFFPFSIVVFRFLFSSLFRFFVLLRGVPYAQDNCQSISVFCCCFFLLKSFESETRKVQVFFEFCSKNATLSAYLTSHQCTTFSKEMHPSMCRGRSLEQLFLYNKYEFLLIWGEKVKRVVEKSKFVA